MTQLNVRKLMIHSVYYMYIRTARCTCWLGLFKTRVNHQIKGKAVATQVWTGP